MRKFILLAGLIVVNYKIFAQTFDYKAELATVPNDGFYNIIIDPEIISTLKMDMGDIRIFSNQNEEVPYILKQEQAVSAQQLFKEYSILENSIISNCCTKLVLENNGKNNINNISLIIRNADVRKKARLSGSDDKQNWYIIKERYQLEGLYNQQQTYEVQMLDFPLSSYQYFKLEIDDSTSAPLNILKAGYYNTFSENGKYLSIEGEKLSKIDSSDKHTYVFVEYPLHQIIDKIKLEITHPQFYYRQAQICTINYDKKGRRILNPFHDFELRSNQKKEILVNIHEKEFCIKIFNKDNAPLKIESIKSFQLIRYLSAYLKAGEKYELRFGNKKVKVPEYDLQYFQDTIPSAPPLVKTANIIRISPVATSEQNSFFNTTWWIWIAIVLVGGLLGYMSWKMVGEMKKR